MNGPHTRQYGKINLYIPGTFSEIYDLLGSMILNAPKFIDETGVFWYRDIDSTFFELTESFEIVRSKLGEERYTALIDLTARAKALFAADPDDTNGKTDEGYKLLYEIEDLIQEARRKRVEKKLPDDEGRVTGD
ncbi:MAG: hypothetical protein C0500_13135 [Sphingobium sp.]|nr:hypothetical protein [Sphingobium sp.]